jgi:cytochrome c oxidase subunit 2
MWSLYFGAVLLACFLLCAIAPFVGWWLPPNISTYGGDVDLLFYVITGFTTFFFVLCSAILVYAMWRYSHRDGAKATYTHGNHKLELIWTAVPAAILLFIAFAQIYAWEKIKYESRMPEVNQDNPDRKVHQIVQVTGRQWEWRLRYPSPGANNSLVPKNPAFWAEFPEYDDVRGVNELHTWKGANVKIYLKTNDVIHSFGLPNLRLMQDALPGKTIPMWFQVNDHNCTFNNGPIAEKETQVRELANSDALLQHRIQQAAVWWKSGTRAELSKEQEALKKKIEAAEEELWQQRNNEALLKPVEAKTWEIACKELCGGRHYAMRGHLYVHENEADYRAWLKNELEKQRTGRPIKVAPPGFGKQ